MYNIITVPLREWQQEMTTGNDLWVEQQSDDPGADSPLEMIQYENT